MVLDGEFDLSDSAADTANRGRFYLGVLARLNASANDAGLFSDYLASVALGDYELSAAEIYAALAEAETHRAAFDDASLPVTDLPEYRGTVADLELISEGDVVINESVDLDFNRSGGYALPANSDIWSSAERTVTEGSLALRVAGNLTLNESFSEGFVTDIDLTALSPAFALPYDLTLGQASWNIALVAGADVASQRFRSLLRSPAEDFGSLSLADQQFIRTGTGDLFVAASGDVQLGHNAAIYTAGQATGARVIDDNGEVINKEPGDPDFQPDNVLSDRTALSSFYPINGGDLTLETGGHFTGEGSDQFFSNWLHRIGNPIATGNQKMPTAWVAIPYFFKQGLATFGGGNINVDIGGDAVNLAVSSPTQGKYTGRESMLADFTPLDSVRVFSSGDIDVAVAGDLRGGSVLIGDGAAQVDVGGSLSRAPDTTIAGTDYTGPGFVGAVMNGNLSVTSGGSALVEAVFNPTVVIQSARQASSYRFSYQNVESVRSYFFTYDDTSRFELNSLAGDVHMLGAPDNITRLYTAYDDASSDPLAGLDFSQRVVQAESDTAKSLSIFPSRVAVTALGGSIVFEDNLTLYPSVAGDLDLLAYDSIRASNTGFADPEGIYIVPSFIDPAFLPDISAPSRYAKEVGALPPQFLDYFVVPQGAQEGYGRFADGTDTPQPFYTWDEDYMPDSPLHADSDETFTIATLTGNIGKSSDIPLFNWFLPGQTRIRSGEDIDSLSVDIYHGTPDGSQFSSIEAGGDIRFESISINGVLQEDNGRFNVHGSGNLWVASEGDIELGTSRGIRSLGDSYVFNLPSVGADISVVAGVPLDMDLDFFYASGLPENYAAELASYVTDAGFAQPFADQVSAVTGETYASEAQTRAAYLALAGEAQVGIGVSALQQAGQVVQKKFAYQAFLEELNSGGLESAGELVPATPDRDDCAPGYARSCAAIERFFPTGSFNEANIDMVASTIQTRFGGDLNVLVPGGAVEVGVASGTVNLNDRVGFDPVEDADKFGLLAFEQGRINIFARDNVNVAESRIATLAGGRIMIFSETGSIDAGRGARTAGNTSTFTILEDGTVVPPKEVSGSGIRVASGPGLRSESINLWAPAGVIDAGEAGISSDGAVFLGAQSVFNADQISAEGDSVGVPETGGTGGALEALNSVTSAATAAAGESLQAQTSTSDEAEATLRVKLLRSCRTEDESDACR